MINSSVNLLFLALCGLVLVACQSDDEGATQGEGVIAGVVVDVVTGVPLSGASLQAQTVSDAPQTIITDALGTFRFTFTTDSARVVTIGITKSGYRDSTFQIQIVPGTVVNLTVRMTARSVISPGGGSGIAQTIAFLGANPQEISVYGVGAQETAILGWEVRDSLGLPIDAAHAVPLVFSIINGPAGGEYVSPPTVTTNAVGRSYTTFTSGIRSGVAQIEARATVAGRTIISSPVRVVIHAGFPVLSHFSIGAARFNFAALGTIGRRDAISVLVGDVYSNPVTQNTAVYFRSSAGVIQATVFTNEDGQGSVDLISGNPAPFGSFAAQPFGDGYHYVVARTLGGNNTVVQDSILILWSGRAGIYNLTPTTFSIPNDGFQDFTFTVADYLGHPLASGTRISVIAEVPPPPAPGYPINQVLVSFGVRGSVTLEDFLFPGPGTTDFSFRLSDGSSLLDTVITPVSVSISVTSPPLGNGNAYTTINGDVR